MLRGPAPGRAPPPGARGAAGSPGPPATRRPLAARGPGLGSAAEGGMLRASSHSAGGQDQRGPRACPRATARPSPHCAGELCAWDPRRGGRGRGKDAEPRPGRWPAPRPVPSPRVPAAPPSDAPWARGPRPCAPHPPARRGGQGQVGAQGRPKVARAREPERVGVTWPGRRALGPGSRARRPPPFPGSAGPGFPRSRWNGGALTPVFLFWS